MPTIPRNYAEARTLADKARARAFARLEEIKLDVEVERSTKWGAQKLGSTPTSVIVDRRLATDPTWKSAVADNQWYIQYATMYGQGDIMKQNERVIALLEEIIVRATGIRAHANF